MRVIIQPMILAKVVTIDGLCDVGTLVKNSQLVDLSQGTTLIIWDEVPVQHKHCFDAVHRTLHESAIEQNMKIRKSTMGWRPK